MSTEVDALRQQYALAYSTALPLTEGAKKKPEQSDADYTTWWCSYYNRETAKFARIAMEALSDLKKGRGTEQAQRKAYEAVYVDGLGWGTSAVLADRIPALGQVLKDHSVDPEAFETTMRLIVEAFAPSEG